MKPKLNRFTCRVPQHIIIIIEMLDLKQNENSRRASNFLSTK